MNYNIASAQIVQAQEPDIRTKVQVIGKAELAVRTMNLMIPPEANLQSGGI